MKTRIWFALAGVALALTVAALLAPTTWAQGPGGAGRGRGNGMGQGGPQSSLMAIAAQQLGMSQAALVAELRAGKTIAQVAADKQIATAKIVDAFVATRKTRLDAAVAAGRLTQAQADAQLATVRADATARISQPWSPRGDGAGFTDADGDGVCDRQGAGRMGGGRSQR